MKILLLEPAYKNKYPPLGLMKIAAFHKKRGDEVHFVKGLNKDIKKQKWSRIYITTLFSFQWAQTIKTIKYYESSVHDKNKLFIGGIMATIMHKEIERETGYKPVRGLLNENGKLGLKNDHLVDCMIPDYSILDESDYKYPASDAYFSYMTRGCIRKCPFCAVKILEPNYVQYIPLKEQIEEINERHGERKDLLLLDNNVLASPDFDKIIDEIKEAGFYKGARLGRKERHVDFNQGVDLRRLTKTKMKRLAELPIKPLRIAFDNIRLKKSYIQKIGWAAEYGLTELSNYILFNFTDTPEDFYERLRINVELNEQLGTNIYSFPMKYVPIKARNRKHVGRNWNSRYLRGIQCILSATHGVVGPKKEFFETAFGKNVEEFKRILIMPDDYIIYRNDHANNGAFQWKELYDSLSAAEEEEFLAIAHENKFKDIEPSEWDRINELLMHYKN